MLPIASQNAFSDAASEDLLTVALATSDDKSVNQHFGSAKRFVIFGLSRDERRPLGERAFADAVQDGNEDKLVDKLQWLKGCDVVVCAQVGQSAAKQLLSGGTRPIVVRGGAAIAEVLAELQKELVEQKAAWLNQIMRRKGAASKERLYDMLDDDWEAS